MHTIKVQDSGRGPVYSFGAIAWHSPDRAAGFGEEPIRNILLGTAKTHTRLVADMLPERVPERLFDTIGGNVMAATRTAIETARGEVRAAQEADGRILEPAQPIDVALASDVWRGFRSMDLSARATAIENADLTGLTALATFGNRVPLDAQMFDRAIERYREENWLAKANLASRHPAQVTVDRILAVGPDLDAARKNARAIMAQHTERLEAVAANEKTAKGLIAFLATVFAMQPDALLDQVMGRDDA